MFRPHSTKGQNISKVNIEVGGEKLSFQFKHYPHFDAPIPKRKIRSLLTDFESGAYRVFYPFIRYNLKWKPFRLTGTVSKEPKVREIRYGSRRDAYIFSYYRKKLSRLYENRLKELDIDDCPIAYRKLGKGKCNIDFAKEAFDTIDSLGNCVAIALDISKYFENLDHKKIKEIWCELLNEKMLPPDHYAVYRNITKYRIVDQMEMYKRLGIFGPDQFGIGNDHFYMSKKLFYQKYIKICSRKEFEEKICGKNPCFGPSLIEINQNSYGIPQGSPISDLIANFYLIYFDYEMNKYAKCKGGLYRRYSDDILLILPGGVVEAKAAIDFASFEMNKQGPELKIKEKKTCIALFKNLDQNNLHFEHFPLNPDEPQKNGFEYLGFRYDGKKVYIRDSTISRFYSKVAKAAYFEAKRMVKINPKLAPIEIVNKFNFSFFSQRFFRVKEYSPEDYKSWTFYSYLKKSAQTFGKKGDQILKQIKGFENFSRKRVEKFILNN